MNKKGSNTSPNTQRFKKFKGETLNHIAKLKIHDL